MDEKQFEDFVYLEDLELNLDVFNFPCPPTFPFSNTQFYRQLKKIAVIDCATMQSFQFPFVAPPVQRQQTEEDKVHQHTPVLMLGELVPNAVDACSAAVRIIVTDHRLVSHDAVEPSLWVNDHEDNWYRLANSYNPQYQSMGKRIVEMVRQCGLNKGVILNYKVCKTPGSTDSMNVKQGTDQHNSTSFALLDVLTDFSTQKRKMTMASEDDDAGYYLVEGHLEVSSMLLKVAVKLHNLEILWPKLDQDRLPVFQANKQFMLNDPDPAYQPYVTAVADMLFGSSSVYKKRKRVPHSEEYFTVTDFVLHYESAESQHCAVHAVSTVPSGVAVLRGKLVPGKSCGRKQYSEPALDMVAYVHDYYVDIDFEKGSTKDKGRMVVCTYFVMSPMSNYWFKLSTPRQDYLQQYIEPNSYISQNFNWPGDHPADVWRRITDYEIMRGEDAQHCSVFKVRINRDSKGWMVCGDLVAPDSNDKLQIRMYPVNNSIDYGCNGDVSDENAGLWVQAPEVAAWYKLHRPPAAAYKEISDRDWDLAEAIMSFQHFVVKTGERATQSSITLSTCRDEDCKGLRKFSIYCGLSRVWEMSKRSFDLDFVRANKSPFKDHVGSFVCIHQSKSFVGSIDDSKRDELEKTQLEEEANAYVAQTMESITQGSSEDTSRKRKRLVDSSDDDESLSSRSNGKVLKRDLIAKKDSKASSSRKSNPIVDDNDDDGDSEGSEYVPPIKAMSESSLSAAPPDPSVRQTYKKAVPDEGKKNASSISVSSPGSGNQQMAAIEKKPSFWDDDYDANDPQDLHLANSKVMDSKAADAGQAKHKVLPGREAPSRRKELQSRPMARRETLDPKKVSEGGAKVSSRPHVSDNAVARGLGERILLREDTGFSSLGLCRHCKSVFKLSTCPNALHKDGQKYDTTRPPSVAVEKSSVGIRQPAQIGNRSYALSMASGVGDTAITRNGSPRYQSSSVNTVAAPVSRTPLVTDMLRSYASASSSSAANNTVSKPALIPPSTAAPTPVSGVSNSAAVVLLPDNVSSTAAATLSADSDMYHERKHYNHGTKDNIPLPTIVVDIPAESPPTPVPLSSPNELCAPSSTLNCSGYLHSRDIFAPLIPKLPDIVSMGMKQLRQFDASRLNALKPALFSEVTRISHTSRSLMDDLANYKETSVREYSGILLTEKKKANRVTKKSIFWRDCFEKGSHQLATVHPIEAESVEQGGD